MDFIKKKEAAPRCSYFFGAIFIIDGAKDLVPSGKKKVGGALYPLGNMWTICRFYGRNL